MTINGNQLCELDVIASTEMRIGAVVGAGVFVLTGAAAANNSGSALAISFAIAEAVCGTAALSHAESAAVILKAVSACSCACWDVRRINCVVYWLKSRT